VTLTGNRRLQTRVVLLSLPWTLLCLFGTAAYAALLRPDGWTLSVSGPVLFGDDPGGRSGDGGSWYVPS
jgi:hypothetical protein